MNMSAINVMIEGSLQPRYNYPTPRHTFKKQAPVQPGNRTNVSTTDFGLTVQAENSPTKL